MSTSVFRGDYPPVTYYSEQLFSEESTIDTPSMSGD